MWSPAPILAVIMLASAAVMLLYSGLFVIGVPLFVIGVIAIGVLDHARRRRHVGEIQDFRRRAKTREVEFTERDRHTLAS